MKESTNIFKKLLLPAQMTDFEARYLNRINRISLIFFALHLPVFVIVAFFNDTKPLMAGLLTGAVLVGPTAAYFTLRNPRVVSVIYGITAMFMGGLLVHFGQGPVQIEMHFYFFALIAMLAVYGNPMVVIAAAVTVALHHLVLWFMLPSSVFNYDAQIWVVAVHAAFVVLESVATCFVARSFFDNVIGLEKIVRARTSELDGRNRDMRLVLDNVEQGFLTIDREGRLSPEHSAVIETWFGRPAAGMTLSELTAGVSADFAQQLTLGWNEVIADVLPLELTLYQMPSTLVVGERTLRFDFQPIVQGDRLEKALVVITDVSSEIHRARSEAERRQSMGVFERMMADRAGFLEFLEEGSALVEAVTSSATLEPAVLKRMLHTLKGNAAIFGVETAADLCHEMETRMVDDDLPPSPEQLKTLADLWSRLRTDVDRIVGSRRHLLEIDDAQYRDLLELARGNGALLRKVEELALEPTRVRLERISEQARRIARRLSKGDIDVVVEDYNLRLDPKRWSAFWAAFIHAVRNATDHGLELPEDRATAGKAGSGRLSLRTCIRDQKLVVEIEDDGRGIDWDSLATKAQGLGLPAGTREELHEALFRDGVTTSQHVSEISGRGVGMGAVRAAARALNGEVVVHSDTGKGTRIEIRFPLSEQTRRTTGAHTPVAFA